MVLSGPAFCSSLEGRSSLKECTLFECRYIYHESTKRGHYFYVSYWRRDLRHFTWSSEPVEGLVPVSALRELSRSFDQNNRNYSTNDESVLVQISSAGVQSLSRQLKYFNSIRE